MTVALIETEEELRRPLTPVEVSTMTIRAPTMARMLMLYISTGLLLMLLPSSPLRFYLIC